MCIRDRLNCIPFSFIWQISSSVLNIFFNFASPIVQKLYDILSILANTWYLSLIHIYVNLVPHKEIQFKQTEHYQKLNPTHPTSYSGALISPAKQHYIYASTNNLHNLPFGCNLLKCFMCIVCASIYIMLFSRTPVSYTHLDVYKRQRIRMAKSRKLL